jgi:hypothetical protein
VRKIINLLTKNYSNLQQVYETLNIILNSSSSSWLYNSSRVFAATVKAFHLSLSWIISSPSFTSSVLRFWLTPSNHRFLGLPLSLFPLGLYSLVAITAFASSFRIACPNHCNRCTFMLLFIFVLCVVSRISTYKLLHHFN